MKYIPALCLLVAFVVASGCPATGPAPKGAASDRMPAVQVYFSPKGGCTDAIVEQLNQARTSVLVQAYSFTSQPIAKAVVDAKRRGVHVQVLLDKSQRSEKYSSADFLLHADVPTAIDAEHAIAHNKVMIIDGEIVITGSFNFSKQAEHSNAENLLILRDAWLAEKYTANWQAHAEHAEPYAGKTPEEPEPSKNQRSRRKDKDGRDKDGRKDKEKK